MSLHKEVASVYAQLSPKTLVMENDENSDYQWESEEPGPLEVKIDIKNIALKQEPREIIDMKIDCRYMADQASAEDSIESFSYEVNCELTFHNNVHLFTQDYGYEVSCERTGTGKECPVSLFTFSKQRLESHIRNCKKTVPANCLLYSKDLRFCIRRCDPNRFNDTSMKYLHVKSLVKNVPTDVNLQVGQLTLPAHKFVLSDKSEVFRAMFDNKMLEKKGGVVNIEEFGADVIKQMLNFVYEGRVESVDNSLFCNLYRAVYQYQLHDLCHYCVECILFHSDFENIGETLALADLYEIIYLKNSMLNFVKLHEKEMILQPSYQEYLCPQYDVYFDDPYTVVYESKENKLFSWNVISQDPLKIKVENIILQQDPSEVVAFEIHLQKCIPHPSTRPNEYEVSHFDMKFENYVHEFSDRYLYEFHCGEYNVDFVNDTPKGALFDYSGHRIRSVINSDKQPFFSHIELNSTNVCFYIRRMYPFGQRKYTDFDSLLKDVPRDISLHVGDKKLPVHKFVLSHSSTYFKKMFESKTLESETRVVKITDFSVEAIQAMLDFVYRRSTFAVEMRYEMLKIARKYKLYALSILCQELIMLNSKYENVVKTIQITDACGLHQLKNRAVEFLSKYEAEMSKEPSYHDYLCCEIRKDTLVDTLLYAKKYKIEIVRKTALDFIKKNYRQLDGIESCFARFHFDQDLAKEIYDYCNEHQ